VLHCIPLLESLDRVDADRLGIYGWSRGGLMTYLALARTNRVRAAVIAAGMSNSFDTVERRPAMETNVYSELAPTGWIAHGPIPVSWIVVGSSLHTKWCAPARLT